MEIGEKLGIVSSEFLSEMWQFVITSAMKSIVEGLPLFRVAVNLRFKLFHIGFYARVLESSIPYVWKHALFYDSSFRHLPGDLLIKGKGRFFLTKASVMSVSI